MDEIKKEIDKGISELAAPIYEDLGRPVLKPIGEILSLFPRTLKVLTSGWDKWLMNREQSLLETAKAVEEKLSNIPDEKLCSPESFVAIPAIQQLCYCQDSSELRDMYSNLLVSSMNTDTKWMVHPAFVDIIKQLTPDEAKILNCIASFKNNFLPIIDVKAFEKGKTKGGHQLIITNFTTVGLDIIDNKNNICSYIDNLLRLNLLEIPTSYYLTKESLYDPVENSPFLKKMLIPYEQFYDFGFNHKIIVISNFGLLFKQVCCSQ